MTVRKAAPEEQGAVRSLWHSVFSDSPAEIDRITHALDLGSRCFSIPEDGGAAAMAHWYGSGSLVFPDGRTLSAGVLYAVASAPDARGRGFGAAVSRAAWTDMAQNGTGARLTVPADAGLFDYYRRTLDARTAFHVRELHLTGRDCGVRPRQIDAAEYGVFREAFLTDRVHLVFPASVLRLQQDICERSGGGLFAFAGGCFSLERTADGARISELLCANVYVGLAAAASAAPGLSLTIRMPVQDPALSGVRPFAMADISLDTQPLPPWFGFAFD